MSMVECAESQCSEISTVASACTTRCPSPTPVNPARPRSTSPNTGKSFMCNHCSRTYASTDAVRKHARQNHPEWLKDQGLGCPSLYCTPVEAAAPAPQPVQSAVAANLFAPAAPVAAVLVPTVVTASPVKSAVVATRAV